MAASPEPDVIAFIERMQRLGARSVKVAGVEVTFDSPPAAIGPLPVELRREPELSDEELAEMNARTTYLHAEG